MESKKDDKKAFGWKSAAVVIFTLLWLFTVVYVPFFTYRHVTARLFSDSLAPIKNGGEIKKKAFDDDFKQFMKTARIIRKGQKNFYNKEVLERNKLNPITVTYPPTVYLLISPFSHLDLETAADAWSRIKAALIIGISWLLTVIFFGEYKTWKKIGIAAIIFLSLFQFAPVYENLQLGQINIPIMLALCLALWLIKTKRDIWAGILLGLIFSIKLVTLPVLLYYAVKKRWKIVIPAAAVILSAITVTAVLLGPGVFVDYLKLTPLRVNAWLNWQNQSVSSFLKFFVPGSLYIRHPEPAKWVTLFLSAAVIAGAVFYLVKRETENPVYVFALSIMAVFLSSPIVWPAHYLWAFIPFLYFGKSLVERPGWNATDTVTAFLLMTIYFTLAIFNGTSAFGFFIFVQKFFTRSKLPLFATVIIWGLLLAKPPHKMQQGGRKAIENER